MLDQKISPVHTPCKSCVFAQYEGKTQNGCALGYIAKYRAKNFDILEVYDNEKEFFVINDKKCIGYREPKWFDQFGLLHSPIQDKISKFIETNKLHYCAAINLKGLSTIEELDNIIQNINNTIIPQKIIIIRHLSQGATFTYDMIKGSLEKLVTSTPWRIQNMMMDVDDNESLVHNIIMNNKKYRFIAFIKNDAKDIVTAISAANNIVYNNFDSFMVLSNRNKNIMVISASSYRFSLIENQKDILSDDSFYSYI